MNPTPYYLVFEDNGQALAGEEYGNLDFAMGVAELAAKEKGRSVAVYEDLGLQNGSVLLKVFYA